MSPLRAAQRVLLWTRPLVFGSAAVLWSCEQEDEDDETRISGQEEIGDGDGDRDGPIPEPFACVPSRGTGPEWDGELFTLATDSSLVWPDEFGSCDFCVSGQVGAALSEWAAVGWNIAQEIDPETMEAGAALAIEPVGERLAVKIEDHVGTPLVVMLREQESGGRRWCAAFSPPVQEIPWEDFSTDCGSLADPQSGEEGAGPSGDAQVEPYEPTIPIAQILIVVPAQSESVPTSFDFCLLDLSPVSD